MSHKMANGMPYTLSTLYLLLKSDHHSTTQGLYKPTNTADRYAQKSISMIRMAQNKKAGLAGFSIIVFA